jgi:hypothetical protein
MVHADEYSCGERYLQERDKDCGRNEGSNEPQSSEPDYRAEAKKQRQEPDRVQHQ